MRTPIIVSGLVLSVTLAGCGSDSKTQKQSDLSVKQQEAQKAQKTLKAKAKLKVEPVKQSPQAAQIQSKANQAQKSAAATAKGQPDNRQYGN